MEELKPQKVNINCVPDCSYKPDFEILDRYINFSSELLRISLLAMGGYGTLISVYKAENFQLQRSWGLLVSMILFAGCSGVSLAYRFWASDSMSWYICHLRALSRSDYVRAKTEQDGLHKILKRSERLLKLSQWLFLFAVVAFIVGLYQLLYVN